MFKSKKLKVLCFMLAIITTMGVFSCTAYAANEKTSYVTAPVVKIENKQTGIRLSWSKVANALKYNVYRKNSEGKWQKLETVTTTSYTDKNVKDGKKYTYTVKAIGENNSKYDTKGFIMYRYSAPEFTVKSGKNGIKISYDGVKDRTYRIYRKPVGGNWSVVGGKDVKAEKTGTNTYVDTSALTNNQDYAYCVKVIFVKDNVKYLGAGKTVTHKYLSIPKVKIAVKKNVFTITWNSNSKASHYNVYVTTGGKTTKLATVNKGEKRSYTYKGKAGKSYKFTVKAFAGSLVSPHKVSAAYYGLGECKLKAVPGEKGTKLTWNAVKGATNYKVYRQFSNGSQIILYQGKNTSYTDTVDIKGKTYKYTVKSYKVVNKTVVGQVDSNTEKIKSETTVKPKKIQYAYYVASTGEKVKICTFSTLRGAKIKSVYERDEDNKIIVTYTVGADSDFRKCDNCGKFNCDGFKCRVGKHKGEVYGEYCTHCGNHKGVTKKANGEVICKKCGNCRCENCYHLDRYYGRYSDGSNHPDHCKFCGRKDCHQFISDTECPYCGKFVKKDTCHHCDPKTLEAYQNKIHG